MKTNIGTVSHGTMRREDLIPAFINEARCYKLSRDARKTLKEIGERAAVLGYYESEGCDCHMVPFGPEEET